MKKGKAIIALTLLISVVYFVPAGFAESGVPCIAVVPNSIVDPTLKPGENFTISIHTNYNGSDIWAWQFSLSYNPDVLQIPTFDLGTNDTWINYPRVKVFYTSKAPIVNGSEKVYVNDVLQTTPAQYSMDYAAGKILFTYYPAAYAVVKATYTWFGVVNGDLINIPQRSVRDPDVSARYMPGKFNNTLGKLYLTAAYFYYTDVPYTTNGPGTLAKIIFRVVGRGASNITLGDRTQLRGWGAGGDYAIIDASKPPGRTEPPYGSDHIGNGYFANKIGGSSTGTSGATTDTVEGYGNDSASVVVISDDGINFSQQSGQATP